MNDHLVVTRNSEISQEFLINLLDSTTLFQHFIGWMDRELTLGREFRKDLAPITVQGVFSSGNCSLIRASIRPKVRASPSAINVDWSLPEHAPVTAACPEKWDLPNSL